MLLATHAESIPPNITCPINVTRDMPAGQNTVAVAIGTPTTSDNCGNDQLAVINNLTYAPNSDPSFSVGSSTVRWTATDSTGNSANCSQTITVLNQGRPPEGFSAEEPSFQIKQIAATIETFTISDSNHTHSVLVIHKGTIVNLSMISLFGTTLLNLRAARTESGLPCMAAGCHSLVGKREPLTSGLNYLTADCKTPHTVSYLTGIQRGLSRHKIRGRKDR